MTKKMDEMKKEHDLQQNDFAQLLDIRAARIRVSDGKTLSA